MSDQDHHDSEWQKADSVQKALPRDHMHPMRVLSPEGRVGAIGKLEFPLPEEAAAFALACNAAELWGVIWDLDQRMRNFLKHDDMSGRTTQELAQEIRDDLAGVIHKHAE